MQIVSRWFFLGKNSNYIISSLAWPFLLQRLYSTFPLFHCLVVNVNRQYLRFLFWHKILCIFVVSIIRVACIGACVVCTKNLYYIYSQSLNAHNLFIWPIRRKWFSLLIVDEDMHCDDVEFMKVHLWVSHILFVTVWFSSC